MNPSGTEAVDTDQNLGEFFLKALDYDQAERHFESLLARVHGSARARVLRKIGRCREQRGEHEPALEVLRRGEVEARAAGDAHEEGRIAYLIGKVLFLTGNLAASRDKALEARELLRDVESFGERGAVENLLGGIAYRAGDLDRARRHFDEALLLGKDGGDLTLLSRAHNNLGLIYKAQCDFDRAIDSFHASLGFDSTASNYDSRTTAWINLGIVHAKRSDWRDAEAMYQRAHKTCVEVGNPLCQVRSLLGLAAVCRARRDYTGAEEHLRAAAELAEQHGYRRELVLVDATRAWMALDRCEYDVARRTLATAMTKGERLAPGGELMCHLRRLQAAIELESGDPGVALEQARSCGELALKCGDRYELATVARIEGAALARIGRWGEAEHRFAQAVRDLRRMGERSELAHTLREWAAGEMRHAAKPDLRACLGRLREAVDLLDGIPERSALSATCHALAEAHQRLQQFDAALEALHRAWDELAHCPCRDEQQAVLTELQDRLEARLLTDTDPERNRVIGLLGLVDSVRTGDGNPAVRFLDHLAELVGADGALLATAPAASRRRFRIEAVSGLRLGERQAAQEILDGERAALGDAGGRLLFAADPRGSGHRVVSRLAAVRAAASMVLLPFADGQDNRWVLYLDRDGNRNGARTFSNSELELLAALAERLPAIAAELLRHRQDDLPATATDPAAALDLGDVICDDPHLREILRNIAQIRGSSIRVLLEGETGTGKGTLAGVIHRNSVRRERPFRTLSCATPMLESELFGHVRDAFPGATEDKTGLLAEAAGGTVFLRDIDQASPAAQRRLLHFLDAGEIRPVGSSRRLALDVRVICATSNPELEQSVRKRQFSRELYYRLRHFTITVPPLRERREAILPLARHFAERFARELGGPVPVIQPAASAILERHGWPGNVRELENAIRRAVVLAHPGGEIAPECLPAELGPDTSSLSPVPAVSGTLLEQVEALEAKRVSEALELFQGNKSRAAQHLGLTRKGLRNKMRRYGIAEPA